MSDPSKSQPADHVTELRREVEKAALNHVSVAAALQGERMGQWSREQALSWCVIRLCDQLEWMERRLVLAEGRRPVVLKLENQQLVLHPGELPDSKSGGRKDDA